MLALNIICVALFLVVFRLTLIRLLIQYQINKVKKGPKQTREFQRKFHNYERAANRQHLITMLLVAFLLGITVGLMTLSLFNLEDNVVLVKQQSASVEDEIQKLKSQQQEILSSISIRQYPKEGIGLSKLEWNDLFEKDENKELKTQMETTVSQKLNPYFGLSQTIISIEASAKTISISLSETIEDEDNEQAIKENIQTLLEELEEVSQLTQVQIQIVLENKKKPLYERTYLRENGQESFKLKNEEGENQ